MDAKTDSRRKSVKQWVSHIKRMVIAAEQRMAIEEGIKALREALASRSVGEVWRWAETNVYISARYSATPGKFRVAFTPYVKEVLECFHDRSVTDLTLCWGSQTAKTTCIMIGVAYRLDNDPSPTLWVLPNLDLAKTFSRNRWQVMVDDCIPLKAQKPQGANARHLYKTTEQYFAKATVKFVGSNSPANISSHPAGLLVMDEVDKMSGEDEEEAGALENAEERTKSFPFPLRVKTSTPTTPQKQIWKQFLDGDQRYYNMPCPHCEGLITFKFEQVWPTKYMKVSSSLNNGDKITWTWTGDTAKDMDSFFDSQGRLDLNKVDELAYYECQLCQGKIVDRHKPEMLLKGKWIPTNPSARAGVRSYHLGSLYAPWNDTKFGTMAGMWLKSAGNKSARHKFINSWLAEPWSESRMEEDQPVFMEEYDPEQVGTHNRVPIMSVDVQENHFWVEIRAWASSGESWMLWTGRCESVEELIEKQNEYTVEGRRVVLDMAHWPNKVAQIIVQNDWRGLWGTDREFFTKKLPDGKRINQVFSQVEYRDPYLGTIRASDNNPRARYVKMANPALNAMLEDLRADTLRYHVCATAHPDYARHINAVVKAERELTNGQFRIVWKQVRRDDHLRDCARMNICCALICELIKDTVTPSPKSKLKPTPTVDEDEKELVV